MRGIRDVHVLRREVAVADGCVMDARVWYGVTQHEPLVRAGVFAPATSDER